MSFRLRSVRSGFGVLGNRDMGMGMGDEFLPQGTSIPDRKLLCGTAPVQLRASCCALHRGETIGSSCGIAVSRFSVRPQRKRLEEYIELPAVERVFRLGCGPLLPVCVDTPITTDMRLVQKRTEITSKVEERTEEMKGGVIAKTTRSAMGAFGCCICRGR